MRQRLRIYRLRDAFPHHIKLTTFSIGWVADEVDAWVERGIRARDQRRSAA